MTHHNIGKIAEILNKWNLLKTWIQTIYMYPIDFLPFLWPILLREKMKIFDLSQMAPNVPLESTRVLNWDLFQMTKHMTKHSRRDDVEYLIDDIIPLQKHAYSNILKILQLKKENFQIKNPDIFHISAQKHRLWVVVRTASARRF